MSAQEQESKALEPVKETPHPPAPVQINNLVIQKQEREVLAMGDADSFLRYAQTLKVRSVVWNEKYLAAVTDDRRMLLAYQPELEPQAEMFFMRESKRRDAGFGETGMRVWEGDYEPIEFTKGNLLKFLKTYAVKSNDPLFESVKNMKIIEKVESHESLIPLDGGDFDDNNTRTVEEETAITNIPTKFTLHMQITQTFSADLAFEAKVTRSQNDSYSNPNKGKRVIQLRVTNARDIMRGLMRTTLDRLPPGVDHYYGKLSIKESRD